MEGLTLVLECGGNFSLLCQNGHCYSNALSHIRAVQICVFCIRSEMHVFLFVLLYAPGVSLCIKCRRCQHKNVVENNRTANSGCGLNSCRTYRCWQRLQLPIRNALNLKKKNWESLEKDQIYSFNLWMLEIFFRLNTACDLVTDLSYRPKSVVFSGQLKKNKKTSSLEWDVA